MGLVMIKKMLPLVAVSATLSVAAVSGYVKLPDGTPVVGASILQVSTQKSSVTDATGFFDFAETTAHAPVKAALKALVPTAAFDMKGRRVGANTRNLAMGVYAVRFGVGEPEPFSGRRPLAKALSVPDTLKVSYEKQAVGNVAFWDDENKVDDIVISRKVVSGSTGGATTVLLSSSEGDTEELTATVSGASYSAASKWTMYKAFRTWEITAKSGTQSMTKKGVKDAVQSLTIDLSGSSSDEPLHEKNFEYVASLDFDASNYSTVQVDLVASEMAKALGSNDFSSVRYYAVNADGTLDSVPTAEGNGHWFDASGNVTSYNGGNPMVFSEMDLSAMTANVGQFPGKLTVGETYTLRQALRSGNNIVYITIRLQITGNVASSSSVAPTSSSTVPTSSYTLQTMYDTQPENIWKFVDWVWQNRQSSGKLDDIVRSRNLIFHQIIDGRGELNYCVRWESANSLNKKDRQKVEPMLNRMINAWVKELVGYEGWPYDTVKVHIVGWAADNASKFPDAGSDEKVYTGYTIENAPTCPTDCSRPLHYYEKKNDQYGSCTMGTRFDMSIWVTDGFNGGAGGDWGQREGYSSFYSTLDTKFPHIAGHEVGHGFGLDDFYETYQIPNSKYDPLPCSNYDACSKSGYDGQWGIVPPMVMRAGASTVITATDAWMLRRTWTGIKNQFGY